MPFTVRLRNLRIAPRKVRLVADLIRGKSVEKAQNILNFTIKKSSSPLLKLLRSAISNAKINSQIEESNLYISKILVDEGPKYKRWMARARGSANEIQKKTSHITLILDEIVKKQKKAKKIKKTEEIGEAKKEIKVEEPKKESKSPIGQPKFKPELETTKPKIEKGIRKIFRRKAF